MVLNLNFTAADTEVSKAAKLSDAWELIEDRRQENHLKMMKIRAEAVAENEAKVDAGEDPETQVGHARKNLMSSTYSRGQIVIDALALAGRGNELKQSAAQWLNYFLLHVGLTFRFPELRKMGTPSSLAIGSQTAVLPTDLGAGMEKQGMLFGQEMKPIDEVAYEEFAYNMGFFQTNTGNGRPMQYMVDKNAGVFRFNRAADQAYPFTPVYYKMPPVVAPDGSNDAQTVWIDNDLIAVEGLVWFIYKFTEDPREDKQAERVTAIINQWKRELVKLGGTARLQPSPARFKKVNFGGNFGP